MRVWCCIGFSVTGTVKSLIMHWYHLEQPKKIRVKFHATELCVTYCRCVFVETIQWKFSTLLDFFLCVLFISQGKNVMRCQVQYVSWIFVGPCWPSCEHDISNMCGFQMRYHLSLKSLWLDLILEPHTCHSTWGAFLTVACHSFLSNSTSLSSFPPWLVHLPLAPEACSLEGSGPDID